MTTIHNAYCLKLQSQSAEYLARWPLRCPKCYGWGYTQGGGDAVEYWGATTNLPTTEEPCESCAGNGFCPRCRATLGYDCTNDVILPCCFCGYEYGVTEGQPDTYCECWMDELEARL